MQHIHKQTPSIIIAHNCGLSTISEGSSKWKPKAGCQPTLKNEKISYDATLPPKFNVNLLYGGTLSSGPTGWQTG